MVVDEATQKKLLRRVLDGRPGYVEVPIALYEQLIGMLGPHEYPDEDAVSEIGFHVPEDDG